MREFIRIVEAATAERTLVIVHPGSACGSADFNLGKSDAKAARDGLIREFNAWNGNMVVIRSDLDDELASYRQLGHALSRAISRNKAAGHTVIVQDGFDPDQVDVIREIVESGVLPNQTFIVTGAWAGEGSGCATSVLDELRRLGQKASFSDAVVWEDSDGHE